jgi:aerobic-type carbon monoxide dehydrogenase small subunit (CoxS/CutS family)
MKSAMVRIKVNGQTHEVDAPGETSLLEIVRNDLGLTGTKYGCGEGQCGACTVLLDGVAVRSCITPLEAVGDAAVETIESCEVECCLSAVQQAFLDHGSMQCGYCVPGMVMAATALQQSNPKATEREIVEHMQGNVCRCCGYPAMLKAIKAALRGAR